MLMLTLRENGGFDAVVNGVKMVVWVKTISFGKVLVGVQAPDPEVSITRHDAKCKERRNAAGK